MIIYDIKNDSYRTTIESANLLGIEVSTTGHMGGDAGHGGKTEIKIIDEGGTCCEFESYKENGCNGLKMIFQGDSELDTITEAMEFIVKILKKHRR